MATVAGVWGTGGYSDAYNATAGSWFGGCDMKRGDDLYVIKLLLAFIMIGVWTIASRVAFNWVTDEPVCHAPTEDSAITDCDYRDGGWYKR
jgi:hypothetical protein